MVKSTVKIAIIPFWIMLVFVFLKANGGVDLENYRASSESLILAFSDYQLKETVSWVTIKVVMRLERLLNLNNPSLILIFLFCIALSLGSNNKNKFFIMMVPLVFFNPFGVMLSQNILRQFLGFAFLFIGLYNLNLKNNKKAILFFLLGAFSHSSVIVIALIIPMVKVFGKYLSIVFIVIFLLSLRLYFDVTGFSTSYGDKYTEGAIDEGIKFLTYALSCLTFFAYFKFLNNRKYLEFPIKGWVVNVFVISFLTAVFMPVVDLPYWASNRILIGLIFLVMCFCFLSKPKSSKTVLLNISFSFPWIMSCFVHPGSRSMLFG